LLSIALVAVGFPLAIPFGLALAFAKMSKIAPLRWVAAFYVNAGIGYIYGYNFRFNCRPEITVIEI